MFAIASTAAAAPQFTGDEVVNSAAPRPGLGTDRGICIGTVEQCRRSRERPGRFDLLVRFELDSAELTPQARANLAEFAKAMKDQRLAAASFVIEGYTDARGGEAYNMELSERRARAVTSFLVENGIAVQRVEIVGRGKADPRSDDPYDPINRRVEMHIKLQ